MRTTLAVLVAGFGLLCSGVPIVAHHSVAGEYDPNKPVTLRGVVTKIEWTNPHARIYIDVTQPNGTVVNWNLELQAVSALVRAGWTRKSVNVGETVTVGGIQARSGVSMANAQSVTLANGRKVLSGSADQ